ncbi:hypothetical protein [uncultured Pseudodesulfovibrio sp.]|uniref:hypothetical protein n=1 Tax=uncultured Pseudodesulfovibrio sp. TaxID=2035858 RepID=UPI0029C746EC|nr:hypothetical protein [uncultured Pseudodesulfovibrio sp.]
MITFTDTVIGTLEFTVRWESNGILHEEWFLGRKFNPVNDVFPRGMREALEGKQAGESVTLSYEPRMCIPRHRKSLVQTIDIGRMRPKTVQGNPIIPRKGRFYPQGHINGLLDVYPDTLTPFRLIELEEDTFTADRNHPLAQIPVAITATIQYMEERETGTYGSLSHWREILCDWGPGMQTMYDDNPTDFFHSAFFDRKDSGEALFAPPAVDATAKKNLEKAYSRFIKPNMRVLDFSMGTERPQGKFDAAVCSFSVEYMHRPVDIIRYVSHFLEAGAPIIIGFSNTFDESNVIQGWTELHEFERMGLVLEYLRFTNLDNEAGTLSFRNDWRQEDDPLFQKTKGISDPIYIVYGHKPK